jgi:hypothetical protein
MNFLNGRRVLVAAIAATLLAACAGQTNSMLPSQTGSLPTIDAMRPDAAPAACKGQETTSKFASLKQTLSSAGGAACIPAFEKFGGTLMYPGATPSVTLSMISSTTNYKHLPELGTGSAIFYLQLGISGATSFGTSAPAGGGLSGPSIKAKKVYTALAQVSADGIVETLPGCYTTAIAGKNGGEIAGLGTLLKNQSVPVAVTGVIEIYAGKQASEKC